ncbi:MAG: transcriptional regulator [Pseudonocardia sp.]|nr:transcriptional regulator [Pseudonocardia sp.]
MKTSGAPREVAPSFPAGLTAPAQVGPAQAGGRAGSPGGELRAGSSNDGGTRAAVARLLLERGPVTAAEVAAALRLSGAAVRRHLDALLSDGEATTRQAPSRGRRARGRPARLYLLTEAGRLRFGHGYDDLAVAALRYLAETSGLEAVRTFARQRAIGLIERYRPGITARSTVAGRAGELAAALSAQGYAAAARRAGNGEQLCQHHCPVAHVAAEFPELCEAETVVFAEVLGIHVQRLATIARGDAACTTHIPLGFPGIVSAQPSTTIPKGRQRV